MNNEYRGILWSDINHAALIVGLGVQMGDNFTHCHGHFTLCCTWHNVLIHTDTLMPVNEAIRIQALFQRRPAGVLRASHHGINCQATEIKEVMERWKMY